MATHTTAGYEFPTPQRSGIWIDTLLLAVRTVFLLLGLAALVHLSLDPARADAQEDDLDGALAQTVLDRSGVFSDGKPGWYGNENWIERALREAEVTAIAPIGIGVTRPSKVDLEWTYSPGSAPLHFAAVFKPITWQREPTRRESYQAEVAAYRLSRFLGLDRVPPTVVRDIGKERGSLQLWVEHARPFSTLLEQGTSPGQPLVYARERARMRLFDSLLCNPDRNTGNFLVAESSHLILIDHSRSLVAPSPAHRKMIEAPPRVEPLLIEALARLDEVALDELLADVLGKSDRKLLLHRRDRILRQIRGTAKQSPAYLRTRM